MATAHFRRYVESGEIDDIAGLLAEDVIFRSPTMDVPLVGRPVVIDVLHAVHEIFRDFRYTDALQSDDSGALFFSTRIGREEARGLDYLRLREDGLISQFHVYIAPLPAVATLSQAMFPRLLRRGILPPIPSA